MLIERIKEIKQLIEQLKEGNQDAHNKIMLLYVDADVPASELKIIAESLKLPITYEYSVVYTYYLLNYNYFSERSFNEVDKWLISTIKLDLITNGYTGTSKMEKQLEVYDKWYENITKSIYENLNDK